MEELNNDTKYSLTENQKKIFSVCEKYSKDPTFVYKYCVDIVSSKPYIVVMQKIDDGKNNEGRSEVINKNYAKFRANKLKVIEIIDYDFPETTVDSITTQYPHSNHVTNRTFYKKNNIVVPNNYDENINNVCSTGIHYFNTLFPALFYRHVPDNLTGEWYEWNENGIKTKKSNHKNGLLSGKVYNWYNNGLQKSIEEYNNGLRSGEWRTFSENGEPLWFGKYCDGTKCRKSQWFFTDSLISEYYTKKGKAIFRIETQKQNDNNTFYKVNIGNGYGYFSHYEFTKKQMFGTLATIAGIGCITLMKKYKFKKNISLKKYHN
jgi:antitoxin component YwqK of YwqJK toxin-antitoxin module